MVLWEWTPAQHEAWETWLASRPTDIQALARQFPPNRLYLLKTTGHRVTIYSYGEAADGHHTLTVNVTNEHNLLLAFERRVFGICPDDLVECDAGPDSTPAIGPGNPP